MKNELAQQFNSYPFMATEQPEVIKVATAQKFKELLNQLGLTREEQKQIFYPLASYYVNAENLFQIEEDAREKGVYGANLYYHEKNHAIYQTTYDAIAITLAILHRQDALAKHLSKEGVLSCVIAAINHDIGYVTDKFDGINYANRTPIHVQESMEYAANLIGSSTLPEFLDKQKIRRLTRIGIHATHFPFWPERKAQQKNLIQALPKEERKEARIIALTVQLADLGGQIARPDYMPTLVKKLREEMNGANPGLGTTVIGEDHQLLEKLEGFAKLFVQPTVGKTANALYKIRNNPFAQGWQKNLEISSAPVSLLKPKKTPLLDRLYSI